MDKSAKHALLTRELGTPGAIMMGLGAILGTGVYVSIGLAAGIAGPSVVMATALAAGVAICNGLSSAQLAANHPVSGGTYEYGYRYLNSSFGFTAGWMFLLAKSASAATAALGFAGYLLHTLNVSGDPFPFQTPLAAAAVIVLTLLILGGMRRTSAANIAIVAFTLVTLAAFVVRGAPEIRAVQLQPLGADISPAMLLHATALMFVAYTGYGRIATLGEEVREPEHTIPRAIVATMLMSMVLYIAVAAVAVGTIGAVGLSAATAGEGAPLAAAAAAMDAPWVARLVALGAITAMLGVLLNLVLGLSRVLLAMGRRRDAPARFGELDASGKTPRWAVLGVSGLILLLVLIGDIRLAWSFSAFTVLIYYAITNLAALQLSREERLYPRWVSLLGLASCLFLAFWVEWQTWVAGLIAIVAGLLWHAAARRLRL